MGSEGETESDSDGEHETKSGHKVDRRLQRSQRPKKDRQSQNKPKLAYYSNGPRAGLLRSRYLGSRAPIYECHDGCGCERETCPNRVVERGRRIPLQIFRTEDRGWGVRTLVDIDKGQFVDRYLGEIITAAEANRRRANATMARRKDVYLFALDKFSDPDSLDHRLAGPPLEVDGEFFSGPTRFVNHSCDPNMRIFARVGDHADKHIHDLALFAVRDIPAGAEITFDYIDGLEDLDTDALAPPINDANSSSPSVFGRRRHPASQQSQSRSAQDRPRPGLAQHINKPLRRRRWTSRSREWTRHSIDRERIDFFDTRVTGHPEIWHTLRAALEVLWEADSAAIARQKDAYLGGGADGEVAQRSGRKATGHAATGAVTSGAAAKFAVTAEEEEALATAQSMLDAAAITLPTSDLAQGAYDAMGNFYALPAWIVSDPTNLVNDLPHELDDSQIDLRDDESEEGEEDEEDENVDDESYTSEVGQDDDDTGDVRRNRQQHVHQPSLRRRSRMEKGKAVAVSIDRIAVRARLSATARDVVVHLGREETVRSLMHHISEEAKLPRKTRIRIAYLGKILKDNSPLLAQGWQEGHVGVFDFAADLEDFGFAINGI
ncbi:histone-lysine n-methyltransferase clr4 [Grosmannia clavigera kw1407]|uniref:Histone-lysine n-methyltransferase clr4 n=1 Tax=Grosmannia clavigera (strain kw1407 / UAMH 11150) TaxID=655863 RepID=F0XNT4_GROCL|nr:histone-lysine n-methyltransferase clr4 [Grosmannia clavigera kw1407]EFX00120.1 histone-lysine n-methyltransferase clr4 [Grosmannia clavigera kw1407]